MAKDTESNATEGTEIDAEDALLSLLNRKDKTQVNQAEEGKKHHLERARECTQRAGLIGLSLSRLAAADGLYTCKAERTQPMMMK